MSQIALASSQGTIGPNKRLGKETPSNLPGWQDAENHAWDLRESFSILLVGQLHLEYAALGAAEL